ncbi:tetratricopeptide (TPR) repeat protein [Caldalkalibacillus uzonensis]|uniref:Tetratricopeptide (TPR) repeat protein n=1 Tax=Caldalkalibacillus uzonensis TaxID=353224 RepID=A0ABU0CQH6_9BACI|nr:hypothetical protein [Caldalkalibacillus uzonensis]MDQ0338663.1 tetratricopeptide (TPR) repeat protein [Caldalkalibacillus uzonensis]
MKKVLLVTISVILFASGVYAYVWFETYQNAKKFMEQADANFERGDYGKALKGGEVYDEQEQAYVFTGGYEHVLMLWSSRWAIPKPGIYYEAKEKIDVIIYEKLSADEGFALFQQYFNLNNRHLPEILLQSGRLYIEAGEYEKAKAIFELAIDAFGSREWVREEAEAQLLKIEQLEN